MRCAGVLVMGGAGETPLDRWRWAMDVNVMGVVHGTDKDTVLTHKAAIDEHLESRGIPVSYTNVFWGGRSEIKPSEISPAVYRDWHSRHAP